MSYELSRDLLAAGLEGVYEPTRELAAIAEAVDRAAAAPRGHRYAWQLAGDLRVRRRLIDRMELEFARDAADFAVTEEYEFQGSVSPEHHLRHDCKMSGVAAHAALTVGEQMPKLIESVEAVENGEIGFAHLAMLASTAAAVDEPGSPTAFDERALLAQARDHSVGRFRHDCTHARHAADADRAAQYGPCLL